MKVMVVIFLFQSFKRKPGQADNERSMGDHNERVHKRLRTIESSSEAKQNTAQSKQKVEEADAFEHIKQSSECYDAQTYGMCWYFCVERVVIPDSNPKAPIYCSFIAVLHPSFLQLCLISFLCKTTLFHYDKCCSLVIRFRLMIMYLKILNFLVKVGFQRSKPI